MPQRSSQLDALAPVRVAIDPALRDAHGPEICWTWRTLLVSLGLPWVEVPFGASSCDIAYSVARPAGCGLWVRADPRQWAKPSSRRLQAVQRSDGWLLPRFEGEEPLRRPLHAIDGRIVCERDIVFDVFWLATGQEEARWPANEHGHLQASEAFLRDDALRLALASEIAVRLQDALVQAGVGRGLPRWPGGKRAAACLMHDVDYPEAVKWLEPLRILRRLGRRGVRPAIELVRGTRTHWHFASWVEMERALDMRSAFYFVGRQGSLRQYATGTPDPFYDVTAQRFADVLRMLRDTGVEVGLHASYRAFESAGRFAAEKRVLEMATGTAIVGNRHHYHHLDPDDPEATLALHEEAGFSYDASLIHDRYVGWRRGLSWPYFPFVQRERRELRTLQVPPAWMDAQLFLGCRDNRGDRMAILHGLADRAATQGGCLGIIIHEYVFDPELFPGWARAYQELLEHLAARSDFWVETPQRIAEHWTARHEAIVRRSVGLDVRGGMGAVWNGIDSEGVGA